MPVSSDESIRELLGLSPVAIVGASRFDDKPAHNVPAYLLEHGMDIIPINPHADEVLGRRAFSSLADVPTDIHLVTVFRPSNEVPGIVDAALQRDDVVAIWLQLGISHPEATARAEDAGLLVVQDRCMRIEHDRLVSGE